MAPKRTSETGYMTLIAGLLDILEEVNGIEVTEEIMLTNGRRRGEHIGEKLGTGKDPAAAIRDFIEYIRPYYEINSINENPTDSGYESDILIRSCLIKSLCKNRGLSIKNPLCRSTHGLIEGALSSMTGMQVELSDVLADWDTCKGTVELKQKKNRSLG